MSEKMPSTLTETWLFSLSVFTLSKVRFVVLKSNVYNYPLKEHLTYCLTLPLWKTVGGEMSDNLSWATGIGQSQWFSVFFCLFVFLSVLNSFKLKRKTERPKVQSKLELQIFTQWIIVLLMETTAGQKILGTARKDFCGGVVPHQYNHPLDQCHIAS